MLNNPYIAKKDTTPFPVWFGGFALAVYIITSIFYIFPSGNPQPADLIMAMGIGIGFIVVITKARISISKLSILAIGFGAFTFVINIIHYLILPDIAFLKSSLYYMYNASMMIFVAWLFKENPQRTWKLVYFGVIAAFALELIVIEFLPNFRGYKMTGTFFNPNQLAKWALVSACILVVIRSKTTMKMIDYFVLLGLGYMIMLTVSKAGIICYALLVGSLILSSSTSKLAKSFILFVSVVASLYVVYNVQTVITYFSTSENTTKVFSELRSIGAEEDESLEGRNYTRIFQNPHFLLLGAGEGGYSRFGDSNKNLEIHSGLGTILFSYGIIGFTLFLFILFYISRHNNWYVAYMIGLLMVYGLVHQNLRFSHTWLFFGVAYGMRYVSRPQHSQPDYYYVPEHNQSLHTDSQTPKPSR